MPQPTFGQVHVNAPLTNISVAYMQSADNFIFSKVFPYVPVDKQSDVYFVYTKNDWFRDEAKQRAPATESAGSGYGMDNPPSYSCLKYALHKDVPDDVRRNADNPLNPDREATEFVTNRLLLRQEIQWTTDYFATSIWGTDRTLTGTAQWSDYANSDPIGDVRTAMVTVLQNTGFLPNTLVLGYQVFIKLIDHPDIVARVQGGSTTGVPALVNEEMLARIFGLERVLVCKSIKATNKEGATGAYAFVQGKSALVCYTAPNPGLMTPSAGYTFYWTGVSDGMGKAIGVRRFRMEHLEADRVEANIAFVNKVIGSDLGYFIATAVA